MYQFGEPLTDDISRSNLQNALDVAKSKKLEQLVAAIVKEMKNFPM